MLGEEPDDVVVVDEPRRLPRLVEHDRVVDLEARVARIGVGRPLEVPQRASVGAVVAAVVRAGRERLARAVGDEERDAARARVGEGRPEAGAQVVLGRRGT